MTEEIKQQWDTYKEEFNKGNTGVSRSRNLESQLGNSKTHSPKMNATYKGKLDHEHHKREQPITNSLNQSIKQIIATTEKKVEDTYNQIINTHQKDEEPNQIFNQKRMFELLVSLDYVSNTKENNDLIEKHISSILNTENPEMGYLLSDVKNFVLTLELYPYYKKIDTAFEGSTVLNSVSNDVRQNTASASQQESTVKKAKNDAEISKAADIEFLRKTFDDLNISHYMTKNPAFLQQLAANRMANRKKYGIKLNSNEYDQLQQVRQFQPQLSNKKKSQESYENFAKSQLSQYIRFCLQIGDIITQGHKLIQEYNEKNNSASGLSDSQKTDDKNQTEKKQTVSMSPKLNTVDQPKNSSRSSHNSNTNAQSILKSYHNHLEQALKEIEKKPADSDKKDENKVIKMPNILLTGEQTQASFYTFLQYIEWFAKIYNIEEFSKLCDDIKVVQKYNTNITYKDLIDKYQSEFADLKVPEKQIRKQDSQECRVDLNRIRAYKNNLTFQANQIDAMIEECQVKLITKVENYETQEQVSKNVKYQPKLMKTHEQWIEEKNKDRKQKFENENKKPKVSQSEVNELQRQRQQAFADRITNARREADVIRDYLETRGATLITTQERQYTQEEVEEYEQKFNEWYESALNHTKKQKKPKLVLNITISKAKSAQVNVYEGDEPQRIALIFCVTHQLNVEKYVSLVRVIEQEFTKRKIPYNTTTPIPVETVVKILRSKLGFSKKSPNKLGITQNNLSDSNGKEAGVKDKQHDEYLNKNQEDDMQDLQIEQINE